MAFRENDPIRSKICINDIILEQINVFNYLGYDIYPVKKI
jgi:hypothetical protein